MNLLNLNPLVSIFDLKTKLLQLPKNYYFSQQELIDFLSRRRWPESNRRIDRTTFWRWKHDIGIEHKKTFSRTDLLKFCQLCDHYRIDGTRSEYLKFVKIKEEARQCS